MREKSSQGKWGDLEVVARHSLVEDSEVKVSEIVSGIPYSYLNAHKIRVVLSLNGS